MKGFAFFDFDGTLIKKDSFLLFAKTSLGWFKVCKSTLLASPWLVAWKIGLISNGRAKERLFKCLFGGCSVEKFEQYCADFAVILDDNLNQDMIKRAEELQSNGYQIVIASASITLWIKPWAERHNIHTIIGTEVEIDSQQRLTGRFSTPNCYGEEKAARIKAQFGDDIATCPSFAYSDNRSDLPMLNLTTHGVLIK